MSQRLEYLFDNYLSEIDPKRSIPKIKQYIKTHYKKGSEIYELEHDEYDLIMPIYEIESGSNNHYEFSDFIYTLRRIENLTELVFSVSEYGNIRSAMITGAACNRDWDFVDYCLNLIRNIRNLKGFSEVGNDCNYRARSEYFDILFSLKENIQVGFYENAFEGERPKTPELICDIDIYEEMKKRTANLIFESIPFADKGEKLNLMETVLMLSYHSKEARKYLMYFFEHIQNIIDYLNYLVEKNKTYKTWYGPSLTAFGTEAYVVLMTNGFQDEIKEMLNLLKDNKTLFSTNIQAQNFYNKMVDIEALKEKYECLQNLKL